MPRRQCKGETKKGAPCGAPPLKPGTVIEGVTVSGKWCRQHDEDLPSSAKIDRTRTPEQMGGRPPLPKPTDVARRLVEENVAAVLRPHFKALGLMLSDDGTVTSLERGAIITGESKDGTVVPSVIEDLAAQIAAAEKLLDRIYGRPKQQTEISGPEGGPVEVVPVRRQAADVVGLLTGTGAVRESA